MSFLKNVRNALSPDLPETWLVLDQVDQLSSMLAQSYEQPVAIFKHSVSCGISNMAKFQLENGWDILEDQLAFYYLDLLSYRSISNEIAARLKVVHQSPQLILVENGEVVFHTSHHGVHLSGLKKAMETLNQDHA
jgi:bacillithiol system protein YtxJ